MTRPTLNRLCSMLVLAGASACSKDTSPTAPTPPRATQVLQGTWTGTIATANGEARLHMTLQSRLDGSAEQASGVYESKVGDAATTGEVTGVHVLGSVSILLTPAGPPRCPIDAANAGAGSLLFTARPDGSRLAGSGSWTQCAVTTQVPVVLTRN